MKAYKIDISVSKVVGKSARDTVCTFPKASEEEAIKFAVGLMKWENEIFGEDVTYFVHSIAAIAERRS